MGLADFKSVGGNYNCRGGFDSLPLRNGLDDTEYKLRKGGGISG